MEDYEAKLRKKKEKLEQLRRRREEKRRAKAARSKAKADEDATPGISDVLGSVREDATPSVAAAPDANEAPPPQATSPAASPVKKDLASTSTDVLASIGSLLKTTSKYKPELGFSTKMTHNVQPQPKAIKYDKVIQVELETEKEISLKEEIERIRSGKTTEALESNVKKVQSTSTSTEVKGIEEERAEEKAFQAQLLPRAERNRIMRSEKFLSFFRGSTKVIERALTQNEEFDVTIDYSKKEDNLDKKEVAMISEGTTFAHGMRTQNRAVTSIMWSPKHGDLFLVSYAAPQMEHLSMDPDGLVLVWSTHTPSRPEYALTCQSAVLVAQFHPVRPEIVIAGTKSGQIIVWDLSVKTTPVNRTSLSQGHTHPVYAMSCMPAVNKAYSILSVSTDGHVCIWQDIDHLEEPSVELDLQSVGGQREVKDRDITTTCFGFVGRDSNNLILGSDEGCLYKARIYDGPNASRGIHSKPVIAHKAPISNVSFRPPIKGLPTLMSELYITSSFDWTTKLWHTKTKMPLYVFERCRDYVYDVKWSPVHPSLFATGDGNGVMDIWNLNKDSELPIETIVATEKERTVSKIAFSNDGRKIAVGSSSGSTKIFTLHEKLALPVEEDAKKFYESMQARIQLTSQFQSQMESEKMRQHQYAGKSYASSSGLQSITSLLNKSDK